MNKTILNTMAALAAVAALLLPRAASPTALAADAAPAASAAAAPAPAEPGTKRFTLVAVDIDEAKFWLPSTIDVDQGDKVELTLKNNIPGTVNQHGFAIPAYKIQEVVTRGTPKVITFVADKPGVFPFVCQLHPAHIGGQLKVEPRK